jgi:23S rRNA (cytidine1920-2'-O)/16S rRNA (cytidine1409-2'-O)-methyltransferase
MTKKRLDELVRERELAESTDKARRMIMAGLVFSEEERLDKPGMKVDEHIPLRLKGKKKSYVSRGGLKLEKAIQEFQLDLKDKVLLDVGSSTGGFTDCALQHGAKQSYAIDVGYNQLDWRLRSDSRVIVMERTNFRYVTRDMLQNGEPDIASIDVSFISLRLIFPVLKKLLTKGNQVIALIKPQFEAKREQVGTGGIVRDPAVHLEVLKEVTKFAEQEGFTLFGITFSPITGTEGNIEFLAYFRYEPDLVKEHNPRDLERAVTEARQQLLE